MLTHYQAHQNASLTRELPPLLCQLASTADIKYLHTIVLLIRPIICNYGSSVIATVVFRYEQAQVFNAIRSSRHMSAIGLSTFLFGSSYRSISCQALIISAICMNRYARTYLNIIPWILCIRINILRKVKRMEYSRSIGKPRFGWDFWYQSQANCSGRIHKCAYPQKLRR